MGQRIRKISGKFGTVRFYYGVSDDIILDFLKYNSIERVSGKKDDITEKFITVHVPAEQEYKVPDHVYTWICTEETPSLVEQENEVTQKSVDLVMPASADTTPSRNFSEDSKETLMFYGIFLKNVAWIRNKIIQRSDLRNYKFIRKLDHSEFQAETNSLVRELLNVTSSNFLLIESPDGEYFLIPESYYWWV